MSDNDYLREDERNVQRLDCGEYGSGMIPCSYGDWVTYDDYQRVLDRLAEARRVLALYHENHTRHWGRCDCDACELAAAALDGASR